MSHSNPLVPLRVRGEAAPLSSNRTTPDDTQTPADLAPLVAGARPTRRQAMQWVMAAVAASALPGRRLARAAEAHSGSAGDLVVQTPVAKSYGFDPDLMKIYKPGDVWPLTFTPAQHNAAAALADVIIPKDAHGPAASEVGVVGMIDEWVSAPYPRQQNDRPIILDGLAWLDAESARRFGTGFAMLSPTNQHGICDDICFPGTARPQFRKAAEFFNRFRDLCASAYYATPEGWKAIGYVGNVALASFDGPPPEVLERLGVVQTVK